MFSFNFFKSTPLNRDPINEPSIMKAPIDKNAGVTPGVKSNPCPKLDEIIPPNKKAAGNLIFSIIKPSTIEIRKRRRK